MRLGILCSGPLGLALLKYLYTSRSVSFVCTDSKSIEIIEFCRNTNLPLFIGNPRKDRIKDFIKGIVIDVLISINYLFVIDITLINLPKVIAFNVHGSLLPKYRGRSPHVWSIINNEQVAGITAHVIDEGCDTGDIILQEKIPIEAEDTGASLLTKYQKNYPGIVDEVLQQIEHGKVKRIKQNEFLATYFGKRTPEDGLIDWNWQRERIHNWVRAQAYPYPGAFTVLNKERIIIDEIKYSDYGFSYDEPNGLIKSIQPVLIKSPNGMIELTKIREGINSLQLGKILNS